MCVIVCKPSGVEMPSEETLKKCFNHNRDGAGYMYSTSDGVYIKKGFMLFSKFYESLQEDYAKIGKDRPFVLHFRIGTMGSNTAGLTHPYPISKNLDELKMLNVVADIGMAHNGILSLTSKHTAGGEDKNDTMAFITDYLSLFIKEQGDLEDEDKVQIIKNLIGASNKLAFLTKNKIYLYGDFTEENGCYFSNTYWKWSSSGYTSCGRYYDDDYGYDYGWLGREDYNVSVNKKEEKKDDANKPLEGQETIEDIQNNYYSFQDYYEECYDTDKKLYDFVEGDCPFVYEEDYMWCDKKTCGFADRCHLFKRNNKLRKREIRRLMKEDRKRRKKYGKR